MAAGYQDFYIEQGTEFSSEIRLTDSYGVPYNLINYTVSGQAKTSYLTQNTSLRFTTSIIDANNGMISISANSAQTANIVTNMVGKLVYDVIIKDLGGNISRVLEGQIFVSKSVSKF
jgi:hypothetical protein